MKISIVTPAPANSRKGNRITALRWGRILRELGHRVVIQQEYHSGRTDLLIALHARRSFPSIIRFHQQYPEAPLILALTGTDLYEDIHRHPQAQQALELASHLVLLQPLGIEEIPARLRDRARVIYQSVRRPRRLNGVRKTHGAFTVCVIGHLRPVKDPFRTAKAARRLPASSRIEIVHVGGSLSQGMTQRAHHEETINPRYHWAGEMPRWKALRTLARSRLLVLTSQMEGGANVISEALAVSVPVLSSRIPGSIGILGKEYPGYFPVGDTANLTALLQRAENDAAFYDRLCRACRALRPLVDPAREQRSWKNLLLSTFSRNGKP